MVCSLFPRDLRPLLLRNNPITIPNMNKNAPAPAIANMTSSGIPVAPAVFPRASTSVVGLAVPVGDIVPVGAPVVGEGVDNVGDNVEPVGALVPGVGAPVDCVGTGVDTVGAEVDTDGAVVETVGTEVDIVGAEVDTVGARVAGVGAGVEPVGAVVVGAEVAAAARPHS